MFVENTGASNKKLGAVISKYNNPLTFLIRLSNTQFNYMNHNFGGTSLHIIITETGLRYTVWIKY